MQGLAYMAYEKNGLKMQNMLTLKHEQKKIESLVPSAACISKIHQLIQCGLNTDPPDPFLTKTPLCLPNLHLKPSKCIYFPALVPLTPFT